MNIYNKLPDKSAFLLIIFLSLSINYLSAQNYPVINESRPRIWLEQSRFDWLNTNMNNTDVQETYNTFVYRYNNWWINDPELYLVGNDSTQWTWNWSSVYAGNEAVFTAFMYKMTNDQLALQRCRFIITRFIEEINSIDFGQIEWYERETLIRNFSDVGGVMLDWCHDSLPGPLRQMAFYSYYNMQKVFMNSYILSSAGTSYVSSHNAYNCVQAMQNALVLYNSEGLNSGERDTVVYWYHVLYDKWVNGFLPCYTYYRDDDGGWNWGAAYSMWSLTDQFKLFDNMRIGTDKNFFTDLPWVHESINQYWYFIQPDNYTIHSGDGITNVWADNVVYRHAALFADPRSIWLAQYFSQAAFTPNTINVFYKLLYKDFNAPVISKPAPPTDWWSDKPGLSVSRSSWESDASLVWFFNSRSKKASHEHRDNNTFAIFKYKPLLVDAGYYDLYGSSHFYNYYTRTVAHNAVCVYDSTEIYEVNGTTVSNDGGQKWSNALSKYNDIFASINQRGKWISWSAGNDYSYCAADAALSYDTAKLDVNKRRLVFLKPDKVVVLDHLHLKNTDTHQRECRWTAHFVKKPQISASLISALVPEHIENYSGTDFKEINGNGQLAVRTLYPVGCQLRLTGGSGYEYWVDGANYPPSVIPDTIHSTAGNWRIEVIPQGQPDDTLVFLHSLKIGDTQNPAIAGATLRKSKTVIAADWDQQLFVFSANGDTSAIHYVIDSLPGGRNLRILLFDLKKNTEFSIYIDNIYVINCLSNSDGIADVSVNIASGNHKFELSGDHIEGHLVYENSTSTPMPGVTVSLIHEGLPVSTCITDSLGNFNFLKPDSGYYELNFQNPHIWGGVNSTDALLIMRHFVNIALLTGSRKIVADVDTSQHINSIDALMCVKRYVGALSAFPSGDWYYNSDHINICSSVTTELIIKCICYGDVNASYSP